MRWFALTALGASLAAGIAPGPALAAPAEQRCLELGPICQCSEPLDFQVTGVGPGPIGGFDPPDSEGLRARECFGGPAIDTDGPLGTVLASSNGLSGPLYVWRADTAVDGQLLDLNRDFTNGTYCARSYFHFAEDFPPPVPGTGDQVKGPRNGGTVLPHPEIQTSWGFETDPIFLVTVAAYGLDLNLPTSGADVRFSDCRESWCRIEYCIDHNLDATQRLQYRARLLKLDGNQLESYGPITSVESAPVIRSGKVSFPLLWFTTGIEAGHFHFYSHVLVAIKRPADASFWIGPASEIERSLCPPDC